MRIKFETFLSDVGDNVFVEVTVHPAEPDVGIFEATYEDWEIVNHDITYEELSDVEVERVQTDAAWAYFQALKDIRDNYEAELEEYYERT